MAAIFGFLARDVAAGTAMGVQAGTWLSIGLVERATPPGATSDPLGMLLLIASVAMTIAAAASASGKLATAAVLGTTAARFATTGPYEITASSAWQDSAGIVGLILCAVAIYTAAAMAIEDATGSTILPLGRGACAQSIEGNLDDQLQRVEREAGVREQL